MILFSSIPPYLQIKIAEQIPYLELKQFVISSKHAGGVLKLTKLKPVAEISLGINDNRAQFQCDPMVFGKVNKRWEEIRQFPVLPRFKVSKIYLEGSVLGILEEIADKAVFLPSGIILDWSVIFNRNAVVFRKVSEMFDIDVLKYCSFNDWPDLIKVPAFREIRTIHFWNSIPVEALRLLKATKIFLGQLENRRTFTTVNLLFRQWFEKKRNLEWFRIEYGYGMGAIDEEIVFADVPFSIVWRFDEENPPRKIILRREISDSTYEEYEEDWPLDGCVYSIDRGDTKLMVVASTKYHFLKAQECTDQDDIFKIV